MLNPVLPRRVAAEILVDVLDGGRTLDDALKRSKKLNQLVPSDRSFVRAMLGPTLRELGRIDHALSSFVDRPLADAPPPARALLRLAATQSWVLGTPDHAVVSESVGTAKSWEEARRAQGFVNAVLRKVVSGREVFEAIESTANWPDWLWRDIVSGIGEDAALQLLHAQSEQPALHITPNQRSAADLADELGGRHVGLGTVELESQVVERISGYDEGAWWVQDASAALPAVLVDPKPGDLIADLCAAPGGKTMQLAASGARVIAVDRSKRRLQRLKQNLKRARLNSVEIVESTGEAWRPAEALDKILLDAPCSALGTLRRHPEGAWIKSANDIHKFPGIQKRLLNAAIEKLRPGGMLVYCVCSPRPQEGVEVVETALANHTVSRCPISAEEVGPFAPGITPAGDLLTIPTEAFLHDAFYVARLVKHD